MPLLDLGLLIERKSINLNFLGYLLKIDLGFLNHPSQILVNPQYMREWNCIFSCAKSKLTSTWDSCV